MDNDDINNAEWHEAFADVLATCSLCGGYNNDHTPECMDAEAAWYEERDRYGDR